MEIRGCLKNGALEGRGDLPLLRMRDKTQQNQSVVKSKARFLFEEKLIIKD